MKLNEIICNCKSKSLGGSNTKKGKKVINYSKLKRVRLDLNNVFYGFSKDGIERCLYKTEIVKKYEKIIYTEYEYIDLENLQVLDKLFVDEDTLNPIKLLVGNKRKLYPKKIVDLYYSDRNQLIDIYSLFYGAIIRRFINNYSKLTTDVEIIRQNVLLIYKNESGTMFAIDLKENQEYTKVNYIYNGIGFFNTHSINYETFEDNRYCTKKKVLEKNYRKELKKGVK